MVNPATSPGARRRPPTGAGAPGQSRTTCTRQIRQPYVVDYVEQQLVQDLGEGTVERGRAQGLHDDQPRRAGRGAPRRSRRTRAIPAIRPRRWSRSTRPTATSWRCRTPPTYGTGKGETTFDYATQAQRQTGSSFKTVRADDADPRRGRRPQPDLLRLAVTWPQGGCPAIPPTRSIPPRRATRATISVTNATSAVRQHRVRAARRRPGHEQRRRDRARDGDHRASCTATRPRRSAASGSASHRCRCPTPTRPWPTAANMSPRRSSPRSYCRTARRSTSATRRHTVYSPRARLTPAPRR